MKKSMKAVAIFAASFTIFSSANAAALAQGISPAVASAAQSKPKIGGLNEATRKTIYAALEESRKQAMNSLVKDNIITAEQMDRILSHDKSIMNELNEEQRAKVRASLLDAFRNTVDQLEKNGTLTKEQAEKLKSGILERKGRTERSSAG